MKSVQCVMEENDIVSAFIKADTLDWLFIDADKMKLCCRLSQTRLQSETTSTAVVTPKRRR